MRAPHRRSPRGSTTPPAWGARPPRARGRDTCRSRARRVRLPARAVAKQSIVEVLSGRYEVGARVEVAGWVRTRRDSKAGLSFIHLSDGSCFDALQLVAPSTLSNYESDVLKVTTGCSARAVGTLAQSQGKGQSLELQVEELTVTGWVDDPEHYPLAPKRHSNEFLREIAHLRPRTNTFGAVARVRHVLSQAIHRFFHERG